MGQREVNPMNQLLSPLLESNSFGRFELILTTVCKWSAFGFQSCSCESLRVKMGFKYVCDLLC